MTIHTNFPITFLIGVSNSPADIVDGEANYDRIIDAVWNVGGAVHTLSFDPPVIVFRFEAHADESINRMREAAKFLAEFK